ncbi:hypothetical protein CDAR_548001 [Caerostris darwini]|uniref:Uncharacterized protein n=1 Tax=Caerostris darwini TaxID=1538125 RepID=A0AAV4WFX1_9ARAC|nr:hypothetical protein CDAR_548001 [Caerostris darwini]
MSHSTDSCNKRRFKDFENFSSRLIHQANFPWYGILTHQNAFTRLSRIPGGLIVGNSDPGSSNPANSSPGRVLHLQEQRIPGRKTSRGACKLIPFPRMHRLQSRDNDGKHSRKNEAMMNELLDFMLLAESLWQVIKGLHQKVARKLLQNLFL